MSLRIQCVDIDAKDPQAIATFWELALGWSRTFDSPEEVVLEPPSDSPLAGIVPDLIFLKVPEDKTTKNRLHLDLRPDDRDVEVGRLEELGAKRVNVGQKGTESWVVLADPEGNEFCVLRALSSDEMSTYEGPAGSTDPSP
ncbi:MAG TPA: VOC family protein [Acidimicrobiia bacterium]|nr:VOC family protein [Acidimicrobiia bacterium]